MPNNTLYLKNLQFESRVLSLFQVVGSHSRKVKAAGWFLQSAELRLLFLAAFVTKSVNLYILKICVPLVEKHWSKLHFAQQRTLSPSFKQQSFFQYQTIQTVHHRILNTSKPVCSQTYFILSKGNWDVLTSQEINVLECAGSFRHP